MTTTAVFAEILAIGIQTVIILGVGLAAIVDLQPFVSDAESWTVLATIAVLAIAYVLGVAVDRLADSLLGAFAARRPDPQRVDFGRARRRVLEASSPLVTFLEYQRSRMRLMRGTVLNLVIAIPVLNLAIVRFASDASAWAYVVANVVLLAAIAAGWYAHNQIRSAQERWLQLVAGGAISPSSPDDPAST
jgi:hypothetical protein